MKTKLGSEQGGPNVCRDLIKHLFILALHIFLFQADTFYSFLVSNVFMRPGLCDRVVCVCVCAPSG